MDKIQKMLNVAMCLATASMVLTIIRVLIEIINR